MPATWTEEEIEYLKDNWLSERTVLIADRLGKTRNSVIGQAHRLQLPHRRMLRPAVPSRSRPQSAPPVVVSTSPGEIDSDPIPLMESNAFQCKAVLDGMKDENGLAIICGKPKVWGQLFSFCSEHLERYINKGYAR